MSTIQRIQNKVADFSENGGDFSQNKLFKAIDFSSLKKLFPERFKKLFNLIPSDAENNLSLLLRDTDISFFKSNDIKIKFTTNFEYISYNAYNAIYHYLDKNCNWVESYSYLPLLQSRHITTLAIANLLANGFVFCFMPQDGKLALATSSPELAVKILSRGNIYEPTKHIGHIIGDLIENNRNDKIRSIVNGKLDVIYFIFNDFNDSLQDLSSEIGVMNTSDKLSAIVPIRE